MPTDTLHLPKTQLTNAGREKKKAFWGTIHGFEKFEFS